MNPSGPFLEAAGRIRLLVFDVDGVLTDGKVTFTSAGDEIKSFNVRDGHAMKMAMRAGLELGIITGRKSSIVERRAEELGIKMVYQGATDKMEILKDILHTTGLKPREIAYMGDDIVDIPVLMAVGLPCAPADAAPEVRARSPLLTEAMGGEGAVRELILYILKAQGLWERIMDRYLPLNGSK
jgi:3-deoxy-D-manno-octulosonate 8-phosphate phosphatase (KDO 8-P phosphatase)